MGLTFLLGISRVDPARKKLSLYWGVFNKSFIDHASSGWLDIGLVPFFNTFYRPRLRLGRDKMQDIRRTT